MSSPPRAAAVTRRDVAVLVGLALVLGLCMLPAVLIAPGGLSRHRIPSRRAAVGVPTDTPRDAGSAPATP